MCRRVDKTSNYLTQASLLVLSSVEGPPRSPSPSPKAVSSTVSLYGGLLELFLSIYGGKILGYACFLTIRCPLRASLPAVSTRPSDEMPKERSPTAYESGGQVSVHCLRSLSGNQQIIEKTEMPRTNATGLTPASGANIGVSFQMTAADVLDTVT
ncbi:hypothetical protein BDP55DRAFT_637603 [Colletotrichum godetiae]|uniref:Uncharacterized protein n=1 Tax=Colletotrichum godetiae TaxID=1209918 RepID=A0AAJ0A8V1_9PEZI|nr:uncharacterized protein BDP55DRAFT_637603 [Colletotrichum godetiae]KAK1658640.1 hypothetical protein BDP55DRAFT_637603 [Colletotrichum godetiae]